MSYRNIRFMAASLLCISAFTMAACSDEDTAPKNDTPWKINNSNSDMGSPKDMVLPRDLDDPGPVDQGPGPSDFGPIGVDMAPAPVDFGLPPSDLGTPDMQPPPQDMSMPSGCMRNSECARSEVCCLTGLSGESACTEKTQCLGGFFDGLCADDSDCGAGEECCDGGQIAQGRKICSERGCGMMTGQSCTTNSECSATNQLCCPGFSGAQCGDQCSFNGGLCTQDAECPGQKCCQFMVGGMSASVCLDRCR